MCFEARKGAKRHQGTKIEENQARSQSRKNQTIQFAKVLRKTGVSDFLRIDRVQVGFEI
jgi:hypothetical protein